MSKTVNFQKQNNKKVIGMNNKVSIQDLGSEENEIKCVLYVNKTRDVEITYDQEEIDNILNDKSIKQSVIIYNPNEETEIKLKTIILDVIDKMRQDSENMLIDGKQTIMNIFPLLTNIDFLLDDLEEDKKEEVIDAILLKPSKILRKTNEIITKMIQELVKEVKEIIIETSKLPQEELERLQKIAEEQQNKVKQNVEETEEERLTREYNENMAKIKASKQTLGD